MIDPCKYHICMGYYLLTSEFEKHLSTQFAKCDEVIPIPSRVVGDHIGGVMQKRRNSSASALELRLLCIKPPIYSMELIGIGIKWRKVCWRHFRFHFLDGRWSNRERNLIEICSKSLKRICCHVAEMFIIVLSKVAKMASPFQCIMIYNQSLFYVMAWHRFGVKPLNWRQAIVMADMRVAIQLSELMDMMGVFY